MFKRKTLTFYFSTYPKTKSLKKIIPSQASQAARQATAAIVASVVETTRRPGSSSSITSTVPYFKLSTIGGRAFPVAARLTDLELTTRHSRFGINTAVVPAPIENFFYFNDPLFISTVIVVSQ